MSQEIIFVEASTSGAGALANRLARTEGLRVALLTRNIRKYADERISSADVVVECETNDAAQVLDAVKRRTRASAVVAVTTTADMYVPQAALAAHALGLQGIRYEAALLARNKHRMRMALARGAPDYNVPFTLALDESEAIAAAGRLGYPLVAKPQEENDGVGVKLIRDQKDLLTYMRQAHAWSTNSAGQTSPPGVLLEAYVSGPEFSVETIQYPGEPCDVIGVTAKEVIGLDRGHFVEAGHRFPYQGVETSVAAAAVLKVLDVLGIDVGAVHTECRVIQGAVKIMEVNPRLAGGKIGSHLIEIATGKSAVQAVLDAALGKRIRWHPERCAGAAIHVIYPESSGVFRGIANLAELASMPGIVLALPIAEPGTVISPPRSNGDRVAEILASGRSADEAYENVNAAVARARLLVEPV